MAEPTTAMPPLAGKGKRVTGTSLLLLGAGIVLESTFQWVGGAIMLAGAAAFVRGVLAARPCAAGHARAHIAPAAAVAQVTQITIDPQPEGRL